MHISKVGKLGGHNLSLNIKRMYSDFLKGYIEPRFEDFS